MSEPLELHNTASEYAFTAQQARKRNDYVAFLENSRKALEYEEQAAMLLKDEFGAEPTRSVLFRSAATLAIHSGEFEKALQMISYALVGKPDVETRTELLSVLARAGKEWEVGIDKSAERNFEYLEYLRGNALNIKIETKPNNYFSKAIEVDAILDALKNVKTSLANFVEVMFRRAFNEKDFSDFPTVLSLVKMDFSPLLVNLNFRSFGASIAVDDGVMAKEYSEKVTNWKNGLFEKFKTEVIEIDYEKSVAYITSEYTEEERNLIYSPIVDTLKEKNKYKIYITDSDFRPERVLAPISKKTRAALLIKPKKRTDEEQKKLFQSFALSSGADTITKKDIFESQQLDYAVFTREINEVSADKEYLVVRNPFTIKVIYENFQFYVKDDVFSVYTHADDVEKVVESYSRILINMFKKLTIIDDKALQVDEREIKIRLLETFTFSS